MSARLRSAKNQDKAKVSTTASHAITLAEMTSGQRYPDSDLPEDLEKLRATLVTDLRSTLSVLIKETLDAALAPISSSLDNVKKTADSHNQRIQVLEDHLSEYSDRIVSLEKSVIGLLEDNQKLLAKSEDLERRSRKSNMRVVGIGENMERDDPIGFMSAFFKEVLGDDFSPTPLVLDRAHRIGTIAKPTEQQPRPRPRVFIVCFHYYQDKERVARRRGDQLYYRGQKVFIFQDHSASMAKKRAAFNDVKAKLHTKKINFGIQMPAARLWIMHEEKRVYFDSSDTAEAFYN